MIIIVSNDGQMLSGSNKFTFSVEPSVSELKKAMDYQAPRSWNIIVKHKEARYVKTETLIQKAQRRTNGHNAFDLYFEIEESKLYAIMPKERFLWPFKEDITVLNESFRIVQDSSFEISEHTLFVRSYADANKKYSRFRILKTLKPRIMLAIREMNRLGHRICVYNVKKVQEPAEVWSNVAP